MTFVSLIFLAVHVLIGLEPAAQYLVTQVGSAEQPVQTSSQGIAHFDLLTCAAPPCLVTVVKSGVHVAHPGACAWENR